MTALTLITTNAGRQAILDADAAGLSLSITHLAVGSTGWTPTAGATALMDEEERVEIASSTVDPPIYQLALNAVLDSALEYWVREVGFFDDDGVLIFVWSHSVQTLGFKSAPLRLLLGLELTVLDVPLSAVTIIDQGQPLELSLAGVEADIADHETRIDVLENAFADLDEIISTVPTFYVDSVDGLDTNDGSDATPWQTLGKALLTIEASGGRGANIYCAKDGAYTLATEYLLHGLYVKIDGTWDPRAVGGSTKPPLVATGYSSGGVNFSGGIWLRHSCVMVYWFTLTTAAETIPAASWNPLGRAMIRCRNEGVYGAAWVLYCDIVFAGGDVCSVAHVPIDLSVGYCALGALSGVGLLMRAAQGVSRLSLSFNTKPGGTTYTDYVADVVRDADDYPMNLLSNIAL